MCPVPTSNVDFYPTLAELAGLDAPQYAAGVSLTPALRDPSAMPRKSALTQYADGYSLRTTRYRYTEWGEQGALGRELYDHQSDPDEMVNLASKPELAEIIEELARILRERVAQAGREPPGIKQIRFENQRRVPQR